DAPVPAGRPPPRRPPEPAASRLDRITAWSDACLVVNRFAARSVTILDVALLARVSKTTVSHVLSGKRPVATRTRERVEDAIRELGYRPSGVARSLRTK